MILISFIVAFLTGCSLFLLQWRYRQHTLQRRVLRMLLGTMVTALALGFLCFHFEWIDSVKYYLILITAALSTGFYILLERLVFRHWYFPLFIGLATGIINYFLMQYKTDSLTEGSLGVGLAPSLSYLLCRLIKAVKGSQPDSVQY